MNEKILKYILNTILIVAFILIIHTNLFMIFFILSPDPSVREIVLAIKDTLKKFFYSISPEGIDIGSPVYLGSTDGGSFSGVAQTAGFIVAAGSNKPRSLNVYVNGTLLGYVVPRGYGTGDIQVCVPVPKNASWSISGKCTWAYWMPLKS